MLKKVLIAIVIAVVVIVGFTIIRTGLGEGRGNATFMSYAPGGAQMAYVTQDGNMRPEPARAVKDDYANGDRVSVRQGTDGYLEIVGGPYR